MGIAEHKDPEDTGWDTNLVKDMAMAMYFATAGGELLSTRASSSAVWEVQAPCRKKFHEIHGSAASF